MDSIKIQRVLYQYPMIVEVSQSNGNQTYKGICRQQRIVDRTNLLV